MSESRTIKKYPNRRLYDTAVSSYVTLAEIKQLVLDNVDFKVIDAKTNDDLTRTILLQIITEEEHAGTPIFSSELLSQFIRFYGNNVQSLIGAYLEKSIQVFAEQQEMLSEGMRNLMTNNPLAMMTQMAERNLAFWQSMQPGSRQAPGPGSNGTPAEENKSEPAKKNG